MNKIVSILAVVAVCSAVPLEVKESSDRLLNGVNAANLQFPYAVSIQRTGNQGVVTRGHRCGGTLVTLQHVVTAASCMFEWTPDGSRVPINVNNYRVFAGASLLTNDTLPERIRTFNQYTVHNDYMGIPSYVNDIAVITLLTPYLNTTVIPIALPSATFNPTDFTLCTVAGWGSTTYGAVLGSTEMRYVNKYVYNQNLCTTIFNLQFGMPNIQPSMICAASFDVISTGCVGDDGNALVCDNVFTGVMALHNHCEPTSYPELYTRVSNYTVWIRSITGSASTFSSGTSVLLFLTLMQVAFAALIS